MEEIDRCEAESEHLRWHEEHVQRPCGKGKYAAQEEMKECLYGWNRDREKRHKMKQVDQDTGLYSIFSAIESAHKVKAVFPLPIDELSG